MESENSDLKNEVTRLRAEMEAILKEFQVMIDTNLGLELKIAAYRRLLEGEPVNIGLVFGYRAASLLSPRLSSNIPFLKKLTTVA